MRSRTMGLSSSRIAVSKPKSRNSGRPTTMKVLVDTMNALHKTGVLPPDLAGMDVQGLVVALSRGRWARNQVLLVCDGNPPPGERTPHAGGIRTIYAGNRCEADDVIEQLIERSDAPTRLLVVSEDRRIIKAARRRRCFDCSPNAIVRPRGPSSKVQGPSGVGPHLSG